jgi:hypothetical protein
VKRKRRSDLDPRLRLLFVVEAAAEGLLKIAALIDLARRPSAAVRGSKARWTVAITLINSAGAVPPAYFTRGRCSSHHQ